MTRFVEQHEEGRAREAQPQAPFSPVVGLPSARPRPLTVSVLGDWELVNRGLSQMLAPYAAQVRMLDAADGVPAGSTGQDAHDAGPPDIILFDCYAGGVHGGVLEARPAPTATEVSTVVAYTWETRFDLVEAALHHGYQAVLAKSLSGPCLVEALERIGRGERVVEVPGAQGVAKSLHVRWSRDDAGLTPREADVLDLIAAGQTNAEIAATLHVSINSVKSYVRSAYRKIGATSRSRAVLWGIAQGLGSTDRIPAPPGRVS